MSRRRLLLLPLLVALALVVPLSSPGSAAPPVAGRDLTVMSRNIYLGSSLSPATSATTPAGFIGGVATVYGTMLFTNFPARAKGLAAEVAKDQPDLIGLQEVARWSVTGPTGTPSLDYLAILQGELAAKGLHYRVAAATDNADIGPVPLVKPCASVTLGACTVRYQDSDVILARTDRPALTVGNPRTGTYATQKVAATPVGTLSFDRGWATVDGTLNGKAFRFASTHLETEDAPAIQQAQGREFRQVAAAPRAVIAVGDFNSATDGSTTTTYATLTDGYFKDAAANVGPTCCQNGTLTNTASQLRTRIDLVLAHGAAQPVSAHRVGDVPFQTAPPFWPSDHAGVVATLRIP